MNERLVERTGYDGTGELCYKVLYDRDATCPWCANERVFEGETVRWELENPIDGRWFYVVNTPIYNEDGMFSPTDLHVRYYRSQTSRRSPQGGSRLLERMVEARSAELLVKNLELTKAIKEQGQTESLRASEERYRSVVDHIGIGVALISRDMEILTLNNLMKQWFPHIDIATRPICYKSFNNPPSETACHYCPTRKTLQDGQVREAVTKTPAGKTFVNYRIISTPVRDKRGKIVAAIEMVEDITETKRMQERLHESEVKYRTIFETTAAATMIVGEHQNLSGQHRTREALPVFPGRK